jgi:peptidyl-prolyl cis-trans isomerase C
MKLKLFLLLVVGAFVAQADNPVVIQVGSSSVKLDEIQKLKDSASADQVRGAPIEAVFRPLRDQKAIELVLETAKSKVNLSGDAEVEKLMQEAKKAIEMQVFLSREVQKRVTDDKLKTLYAEILNKVKGQKEIEVSLILADDEAAAGKAMVELNTGKDFGEVAQQYSVEANTKKRGGLIGFLLEPAIPEVLGKEVAQALKILKDGFHSKKIIKAKDGKFLIVRRGTSRAAEAPKFEEVKPQLTSMYSQKGLMEYLDELKKSLNVKVFTIEGKPDVLNIAQKKQ